jgi:rSAM/selenodomain-associated transferase 1
MHPARCLIIFTRHPEPGRTKTRLIPVLGAAGAADLQRRMTEHLIARAAGLVQNGLVTIEIRFEGGGVDQMAAWLGGRWTYRPQGEGDLGRRMGRAFAEAFKGGAQTAVIVGTDIPDISTAILTEAFDRLADHDLVIGPAADGGYYLIGTRCERLADLQPVLLGPVAWGTDSVFQDTLSALAPSGVTIHLLPRLRDVDRPEDLPVWETAR